MIIRPFREGEEGALRQVFLSAVHGTASRDYRLDQVEAWAPEAVDPEAWASRIRAIRPCVAEEGGVILGYADLQPDGHIDHFFVAAEAGGKGVGSALMGRLVETALERGIPFLHSEVSLTARAFFERWGFVAEAAQTVVIRGVPLENFKMRRPMPLAGAGDP
jgi:putative acetyltransferase